MTISPGMYFSRNKGEMESYDFKQPLTVNEDEELNIVIIDCANQVIASANWREIKNALIPPLIGDVGERAKVSVTISNSANVEVKNNLTLGTFPINETESEEAALIATIVNGAIGKDATINIKIENSANVNLLNPYSVLNIDGGSLIEEVINIPDGVNHLIDVAFYIEVSNSAQVNKYNSFTTWGELIINKGQLINEVIDCVGIYNGRIDINETDVATVYAHTVKIFEGELVDEILDTLSISDTNININLKNVANVYANDVNIKEGELVDELIDSSGLIERSNINIVIRDSACINGNGMEITSGELLDEVIDTPSISDSTLDISLYSSAIVTGNRITLTDAELVDEIIDCETLCGNAKIKIDIVESVNVNSDTLGVINSQLLDEVIDCATLINNRLTIQLTDSVCVKSITNVEIVDSVLMADVIDAEYAVG